MPVEGALVLPDDIQLVPVRELPAAIRARLPHNDHSIAIARPVNRASAKIIDEASALFLRTFTEPHTVVDAVLSFAASRQLDPVTLFDQAYPLLERMIAAGFLVQAGSAEAGPRQALLQRGTNIGPWRIGAIVYLAEDVEVYQARRGRSVAALKIARTAAEKTRALIDTETRVLACLAGSSGPTLLAAGEHAGRPYIASRWIAGVDAETAASDLRMLPRAKRRPRLAKLCAAIAEAYAELHERGVIHGDVHAKNIRVDAHGKVALIDFGWSVIHAEGEPAAAAPRGRGERGGAGFLFEPELARASLAHRGAPPPTHKGEQYLVAALLDALWVGVPYLELSLDWDRALREIATAPPRTFEERGVAPEPELESLLRGSLAKRPSARHGSMRAVARALSSFAAKSAIAPARRAAGVLESQQRRFALKADGLLAALGLTGTHRRTTVQRAPFSSVACGAAGVAYAFYRLAMHRADPLLLASADTWVERALANVAHASAFVGSDPGLSIENVGEVSLLHAAPGLHMVHALISAARGDRRAQIAAAHAFVRACTKDTSRPDITHGRAGLLLGCSAIVESFAPVAPPRRVLSCGNRLERNLWQTLSAEPRIGSEKGSLDLGMAHGWSGALFSLLRWNVATGRRPPTQLMRRMRELAEQAEPYGRGVRWPWLVRHLPEGPREPYVAGWCNGAAGLVHLWCLASTHLHQPRYRDLAVGSAWHAWESEVEAGPFLCCGLAGRAFSLAAVARLTGDGDWWFRARRLASGAVRRAREQVPGSEDRPDSLFFGALGIAVLLAELDQPGAATMPLFGPYA